MEKSNKEFIFKNEELKNNCRRDIEDLIKQGYDRQYCGDFIKEKYKLNCCWATIINYCYLNNEYKENYSNLRLNQSYEATTGYGKLRDREYRLKLVEEYKYLKEKIGMTVKSLNLYFKEKYNINGNNIYNIYKGKRYNKPSCSVSDRYFYLKNKYEDIIKDLKRKGWLNKNIYIYLKEKYNDKYLIDEKDISRIYNNIPCGIKVEEKEK